MSAAPQLPEQQIKTAKAYLLEHSSFNLKRLYLSTFLLRSAFGVVTLLLPIYLADLQKVGGPSFSGVQIGMIVGSIFLSEIVLVTIFGRLSDILQVRGPFIVIGNVFSAVAFSMFSFFTEFVPLFTAHLVEGIGAAMVIGPALAMIGESTTINEHGEKYGLFETATFGGMAFGFLVGGLVYDRVLGNIEGYGRWTFLICSVFLLSGGYIASQIKETKISTPKENFHLIKRFYREIIPHKPFLIFPVIVLSILTLVSSIELLIQGQFSLSAAIFGRGLDQQYIVIFYGASVVSFILGLIDFYLEIRMSPEEKRSLIGDDKTHIQQLSDALKNTDLKKILPAWFLIMIILGTVMTFLPIILSTGISAPGEGEQLSTDEALSSGLRASSVGIYFVVGISILGVMQVVFGKLVDKYGRKPILLVGVISILLLSAEIVLVVSFFPEWFINPFEGNGLIFVIVASITGLGVSGFGPAALSVLADNSSNENRGAVAGIYSLLLGLGHIFGDIFGGLFYDVGRHLAGRQGGAIAVFLFCVINATIALIVVIKIDPNPPQEIIE